MSFVSASFGEHHPIQFCLCVRTVLPLQIMSKDVINEDDLPEDDDGDLPDEDDDDCEEDAVAKEAKSASIEPLVGHPRAIVAH